MLDSEDKDVIASGTTPGDIWLEFSPIFPDTEWKI